MIFKKKRKYQVKTYGAAELRAKAKPVARLDGSVVQLAADMIDVMEAFDGIGLAAPQIGLAERLIVLGVPSPENVDATWTPGEQMLLPRMPLALVNPEIVGFGTELGEYDEGCLSVPELYATVVRPLRIFLKAALLDGSVIECECGGLLSRCIQHEIDHLDGILFPDRVEEGARGILDFKLGRLENYGKKHNFERPWKR